MKTRQEKLDFIYDKVANKELSFGCRIHTSDNSWAYHREDEFDIILNTSFVIDSYNILNTIGIVNTAYTIKHNETKANLEIKKIIGHPVLIGDLLDYIDKNLFRNPTKYEGMYEIDIEARSKCITTLYNIFIGNYRNPIEKLGDSEIEWIFNLISNNNYEKITKTKNF